ncbi:hypothetical protein WAB17_02965 [Parerythrobacter aurantius]|uniref:phosphoribosyl-AMP cyclohydrolase n=1 Tax=Parerythrobacter aurantius TaxID=3127706 RepID=UPI00324E016F
MTTFRTKALGLAAALPLAALATPALADDHSAAATAKTATYAPITKAEVEAAQTAWCNALVAIATENDTKGQPAAKALAKQVLDGAYAYDMGPVLFKPTLTVAPQTFRTTYDGALAYFVGGDKAFPTDTGFALKGWRKCEASNMTIAITGTSAMATGNVSMWDSKGAMTMVDKTWGYVRGPDGNLRIVLHHSSLPYKAG